MLCCTCSLALFRWFPEEDVLLQRDTASASLDSVERAELCGKEMRSDMAAFKEAKVMVGPLKTLYSVNLNLKLW